jgi:hypothetical protein
MRVGLIIGLPARTCKDGRRGQERIIPVYRQIKVRIIVFSLVIALVTAPAFSSCILWSKS